MPLGLVHITGTITITFTITNNLASFGQKMIEILLMICDLLWFSKKDCKSHKPIVNFKKLIGNYKNKYNCSVFT